MTGTVAILGCGYVGIELGGRLADEGWNVVGVRRSSDGIDAVESAGLTAVRGDATDASTLTTIPDADVVVYAASPGRRGEEAVRETYVEGQRAVLDHFGGRSNPPDRYLYTSSTGVYGDHDGAWVDEETPLSLTTERERILVDAETVALDGAAESGIDGTVARFAGLYGPGRYRLGRYLEGPVTEGYLNLTHRDDAAGALAYFLREDCARDDVVLVVDDEPVSKWDLADWLAAACGEPEPPKQTKAQRLADETLSPAAKGRLRAEKRCRNDKLRGLGYELAFSTFREGYRDAIEAYSGDGSD